MKNIGKMMKQAQDLKGKMATLQEKLAELEISGSSGGGKVQVTLNGKGEARKLMIDPSFAGSSDTEMLEDLILAAFNDAKSNLEKTVREEMSELTGGLNLPPGLGLPF